MSSPEDELEQDRRRRQLARAAETLAEADRRIARIRRGPVPSAEICSKVELIARTANFALFDLLNPEVPRQPASVMLPWGTPR